MSSDESRGNGAELQAGDCARDTREGFAELLRKLFAQTGMSTNQFESVHGFSDGTVSSHQRGKTVPQLEFVEALLAEVRVNPGISEEAADQVVQDYGRLLHRLVAAKKPHLTHQLLLRCFTLTMELRSVEQQLTEEAAERQRLGEELAAATTSHARKEAIRAEEQQLLVRRDALLAQRAAVSQELLARQQQYRRLVRQAGESPFRDSPDLHGAHAPHSPEAGGRGPRTGLRFVFVVGMVAVVVLALGVYTIHRMTGQDPQSPPNGQETPGGGAPEDPSTSGPSTPETSTPSTTSSKTPRPRGLRLADLNFTGSNWIQGAWSLNGERYENSLASNFNACYEEESVVFPLPHAYQRFTATVGVDDQVDDDDRESTVSFDVYADLNEDKEPDRNELVASRGARFDKPATINADIQGATQLILVLDYLNHCMDTAMVWGDPQVS